MTTAIGNLFVIAAPSGAGKTSLVRALVTDDPKLQLSVSNTTRAPRPGEVDGEHYHFTDMAHFRELIAQDRLLEHAEVHGNCYGTGRDQVEAAFACGRDVILEIDWQGGAPDPPAVSGLHQHLHPAAFAGCPVSAPEEARAGQRRGDRAAHRQCARRDRTRDRIRLSDRQ